MVLGERSLDTFNEISVLSLGSCWPLSWTVWFWLVPEPLGGMCWVVADLAWPSKENAVIWSWNLIAKSHFSIIFVWTPDPVDSQLLVPPFPLIRTHEVFWVSSLPHTNHNESKMQPQVLYLDNSLHPCCTINPYLFETLWQAEWRASPKTLQCPSSYDLGSSLLAPSGLMNPCANW